MKKPAKQSQGLLQIFIKPLILSIFWLVFRPRIMERHHVPKREPVIIVANHKHNLDPLLIGFGRKRRRVHFIAKQEIAGFKVGWLVKNGGAIFVDRAAADKTKVKNTVADMLRRGRAVALFPEGTRNKTTELLIPFKHGAVSMAQKNQVRIVPAAIVGWYRPGRRGLKIIFDAPIDVAGMDLGTANELVRQRIERLLLAHDEPKHRPTIARYYKRKGLTK
jgi:1-acyl-sn-glycerol-3-phosphate acyltransferase